MNLIQKTLQYPALVTHILGADNYSWVHFQSGEKKLLSKSISYFVQLLPGFIRTHKSVLINPAYVQSLYPPPTSKKSGAIQLNTGEQLPIGRRQWLAVQVLLLNLPVVNPAQPGRGRSPSVTDSAALSAPPGTRLSESQPPIILMTEETVAAPLLDNLIDSYQSGHRIQLVTQSQDLPASWLEAANLPALLLLDARTNTQDRFLTLQRIKQAPSLRHLPTILFVLPVDPLINQCYRWQANSVIGLPATASLVPFLAGICRYWLRTSTLPTG